MKCVVMIALVLTAAACTPSAEESDHRFAVPSDSAAEGVVRSFLDAAKAGDTAQVGLLLCDKSEWIVPPHDSTTSSACGEKNMCGPGSVKT